MLHWRHVHRIIPNITPFIFLSSKTLLLLLIILLLMLKKHLLRPKWLIVTAVIITIFAIIEEKVTFCIIIVIHKHWLEEGRLVDEGVVVLAEVRGSGFYTWLLVAAVIVKQLLVVGTYFLSRLLALGVTLVGLNFYLEELLFQRIVIFKHRNLAYHIKVWSDLLSPA